MNDKPRPQASQVLRYELDSAEELLSAVNRAIKAKTQFSGYWDGERYVFSEIVRVDEVQVETAPVVA